MTTSWVFWALLSALFAGTTAVLAKIGVKDIDSNLATAIRTTVILVFAWAIAAVTAKPGAIGTLTTRTLGFLCVSGLATGLSWLCYFRALQLGPASRVAPIDKLSVVFVLAFAALFLNEPLSARSGLGTALIAAGAIVLAWKS